MDDSLVAQMKLFQAFQIKTYPGYATERPAFQQRSSRGLRRGVVSFLLDGLKSMILDTETYRSGLRTVVCSTS